MVETQSSVTPNNYAYRFIDTTLRADEPDANLVTLVSSFTGEPDNIEIYENKIVTIDAVITEVSPFFKPDFYKYFKNKDLCFFTKKCSHQN